jgi:hypothetical protein
MPDATITSTASTFGTISGVFSADQSTISGTISGIVPGTLTGSVGVPGPAGAPGQGVPAGGASGQFLQKVSGVDYATDWVTLNLSAYLAKASNLSDLASTSTARTNLGLGSLAVFNDAPSDGSQYARKNAAWEVVTTTPDFISSVSSPLAVTTGNLTIDLSAYAPISSPVFTGDARAVTPAFGDNDTSISTTAFVQSALLGGTAVAKNLEVEVRNQSGSTIPAGSIVYISGATGNKPLITLAQANNDANSAQTIGFVKTSIANNGTGFVIVRGELENIDTSALTEGVQLYLSPTTAGTWTTTKPSAPQHLVYVGVVIRSHPTLGTILVAVQNGYELDELHDVAIASKANNDLLAYESSTDLWKNKTFSALGLLTSADAASTYLTSATAASTYQTISGMSSYLTTASAASTYFTIASAANKADLASPAFTGTPSLPTGTTAVTQTAGNNTTAVATTAFVQQEVPAASTTAAGKVELATVAETIVGTSTSLVSPLSVIPSILARAELRALAYMNYAQVSGSGSASTPNVGAGFREIFLGSLAAGRASFSHGVVGTAGAQCSMSRADMNKIDFSKKVWMAGKTMAGGTLSGTSYIGDANTLCRVTLGGYSSATTGDMTLMGIGWKKVGGTSPFFTLTVHNGTTRTDVATSVSQSSLAVIDWVIYSDGTGNVTLYINGAQAATTTAGPTGITNSGAATYREQVEATATPAVRQVMHNVSGWLYIEG